MHGEFGTSGFSDALVILGAAGIIIPAFARLRITPVIGFILVGMIVGPSGLGGLTDEIRWLNYLTISNPEAIDRSFHLELEPGVRFSLHPQEVQEIPLRHHRDEGRGGAEM